MGFAEIQAAFAATAGAPPQPATAAFAPSPFAGGGAAVAAPQGVQGSFAFTPPPAVPGPAAPAAFAFTPPAGAPTFAPINPPGERAALADPFAPVAAAVIEAPAHAAEAPAEPKAKRTRKAKFTPEDVAQAAATSPHPFADQAALNASEYQQPPSGYPFDTDPAKVAEVNRLIYLGDEGAAIAKLPADGSTVEDIVQELFARGVSSVHLTFTRGDGSA